MSAPEIKLVIVEPDGTERPATPEEDLDCFLEFFRQHQADPSKPLPLWELVRALDNEDHIARGHLTKRSRLMIAAYGRRLVAEAMCAVELARNGKVEAFVDDVEAFTKKMRRLR